jgi:hypothetical protein
VRPDSDLDIAPPEDRSDVGDHREQDDHVRPRLPDVVKALALDLGSLAERSNGDAATQIRLKHSGSEVARSLDELRGTARGLHPAVVSGHG